MNKHVDDELLKQMNLLVADIKLAYEASGKKVSGEFEKGLELKQEPNSITLLGYTYLAGRAAGKFPPIENIKRWIEMKGIRPISDKVTVNQLAFLIARKISQSGTNEANHLKIYETVVTPLRIQQIIESVNQVNVNWFIAELSTQMTLLTKNK